MARMTRLALALPVLLAGCGQDIDLGNSRMSVESIRPQPPAGPSTKAAEGCPFDDPALLAVPGACPGPATPGPFDVCLVTAEGALPQPPPRTVPACPIGVYFAARDPLPPAENIERAVLVLKGDDNDKSAFAAESGTPLPRTVEVFPDRRAFFVRLDPRPSEGLMFMVRALCAPLYEGEAVNRCGFSYAIGATLHAGAPRVP